MSPSRKVTPLSQIDRFVQEAGRIRMGIKVKRAGKKDSMKATDTFRFTSATKDLLEQLAVLYGGLVEPWYDERAQPKNQFQLMSMADRINVMLIPDGISQWYEEWSGGGNLRRCDGVTMTVPEDTGPHDYELVERPCICNLNGKLQCKLKTRLSFVLPDISFAGSWRLESGGQAASKELPAMYDLIAAVTSRGRMVQAQLSISHREHMTNGKKNVFIVPELTINETPLAMASGAATLAVGSGDVLPPTYELERPPMRDPGYDTGGEDEPIDAEVLTEEMIEVETRLKADALQFGFNEHAYVEAVRAESEYWFATKGEPGVWERMRSCSDKVRTEQLEPVALSKGKISWKTTKPSSIQ